MNNRKSPIINNKYKIGRRPYGFYTDEAALIEIIRLKARRRKGAERPPGPWMIARELNEEGFCGPGGGKWCGISVKRILARQNGTAEKKPAPRRKKIQLESGDYLSKEEVAKCRAVLRDSDRVLFEVLLGAGLRSAECCALNIKDLGMFRGKSQIDVRRGKGAKGRAVIIGPRLRSILKGHYNKLAAGPVGRDRKEFGKCPVFVNKKGKRMTYSDLYYSIAGIRDRSGVLHLHPHALRHTFAVFLYNYKSDLEYVRMQLGHVSIATTQIYAKTLNEYKLEQMEGFESSFSP